jgi:hypothetical protein
VGWILGVVRQRRGIRFLLLVAAIGLAVGGMTAVPACSSDDSHTGASRYPDGTAGLEQLFTDLCAAIAKGDKAKARALTRSLALSDARTWFTVAFGSADGQRLSAEYASAASSMEGLADALEPLVARGQTRVVIDALERPSDPDAVGYQDLALQAMKRKITLYSVRLVRPAGPETFHIWSFVYDRGGFRWIGKLKALAKGIPEVGPAGIDPLELRPRDRH